MATIPASILDAAIEYAKVNFKIDLNRRLLARLYWQVRIRRKQLKDFNRRNHTRVSTDFYAAREWVLDQRFPQCGPEDQFLRKAYSSALGKIGNSFGQRAQPGLSLKRPRKDRVRDFVTLSPDRRQYRLIV